MQTLQQTVWQARIPLEIRLAASESRTFDGADPYLIAFPRLSYLPLLLPRLHAFFYDSLIADPESISPYAGHFTYDNVPLKWHLPLGLLYDIYVLSTQDAGQDDDSPSLSLPFKLTLHFAPDPDRPTLMDATPVVLHDSFINSVKEADFLRSGTAKPIMSLSAHESKALWTSTQDSDVATFSKIHGSLVPSPGQMRNIPLRIYLPSTPDQDPDKAQIKVLQSQIATTVTAVGQSSPAALRGGGSGQPQTLGTALHQLIPSLFPSRRTPILATPLLHGAPLPMNAHLEELVRWGCYADGWLSVVLAMRG
ncbi:Autophagy protein 5 [Elasticomyces elasticus]|uniref:Autophagy protein 5 n=1 Tax=Exophiala sideris TaxID=1016849 RepID=A0ABR0J4B2_9EURO|nr:Autophagy protein 5 [Elasticomyces elasticus]KAK5027284.1 Autophagy protein 5 [Exophiala sideris]KAK5035014.1 Autophagy protein 5 [Exophiala sideris]KAK5056252.1 Autophagy protein 5 [Exophiala sideris]KAK5181258.1 Autophagy protein 5 [Eurotiomycetes sp. CCFEE 6388]